MYRKTERGFHPKLKLQDFFYRKDVQRTFRTTISKGAKVCKGVHCVDLVKSFPTHFFQKLANMSIIIELSRGHRNTAATQHLVMIPEVLA